MQKSFFKLTNISVSVLLMSIILIFMRSALLIFGFDFESSFFKSDALAYSLYALLIVSCALAFAMSRSIMPTLKNPPKSNLTDVLLSLATIIFVCFFVIYITKALDYFAIDSYGRNPLKTASFILCIPSSILSTLYYLVRLFASNKKSGPLSLLAVFPVIFLSALLLERFATVSASAASLCHFPDVISLLILAFFILNEGKLFIPNDRRSAIIPSCLISFIALSFSSVPDLITLLLGRNVLNFEAIIFLILKAVFAIYALAVTALVARDMEDIEE